MAARRSASLIALNRCKPRVDQTGELRVGRELSEPVGPKGNDEGSTLRVPGQRGEERGLLDWVITEGDGLLALVDHEHRRRTRRGQTR